MIHVKDFRKSGGRRETVIIGDGMVDWAAVAAAAREIGYDGFLTLEVPGTAENAEEIAIRSRDALRQSACNQTIGRQHMAKDKLRVAMVSGAGIGANHISCWMSLEKQAKITAVMDVDAELAKNSAHMSGDVPWTTRPRRVAGAR